MDFKSYRRPFRIRTSAGLRPSWALIELSVGLRGLYSDPIIVSGYVYNLLKYPVPEADILIRISAEGVVRNQKRKISVYPYSITAQKPYPDNPWSRPKASSGSTPGGGDTSRYRSRHRDEASGPKPRAGEYPCWQCGKVGHGAEVCPDLDARLRDRLAIASRWSPLGTSPGSHDTQRAGRRVAVSTPKEDSSSSGENSTPLEKGEPQTEPECGPATSSESEEGNE